MKVSKAPFCQKPTNSQPPLAQAPSFKGVPDNGCDAIHERKPSRPGNLIATEGCGLVYSKPEELSYARLCDELNWHS